MKATEFLRKGADLLEERGKQYDQPGGERSMGKTVRAFNAITGRDLSEAEGWLLLQVLKDVRQWQNPEKYHADSAEDCVSYAALKAEALASNAPNDIEPASAIDDDSERQQLIQQSGEMAEEVYAAVDGKPSWDVAPDYATHLLRRVLNGKYEFGHMNSAGEIVDGIGLEFVIGTDTGWYVDSVRPQKDA